MRACAGRKPLADGFTGQDLGDHGEEHAGGWDSFDEGNDDGYSESGGAGDEHGENLVDLPRQVRSLPLTLVTVVV